MRHNTVHCSPRRDVREEEKTRMYTYAQASGRERSLAQYPLRTVRNTLWYY